MKAPAAKTRLEEVYTQLRWAVMSGRLRPGDRVKLAELCVTYGVSLSVVREAATRLAESGLLRSEPNRGFRVASLSRDDLEDLTYIRIHIETLCVSRAIELGDTSWEAAILAAQHTLRRAEQLRDDTPEADLVRTNAHSRFHAVLAAGCGSPRMLEYRQSLFDSAELYRHWSLTASASERNPALEHDAMALACLDRDAPAAIELLTSHIRNTADWLLTGSGLDNEIEAKNRYFVS